MPLDDHYDFELGFGTYRGFRFGISGFVHGTFPPGLDRKSLDHTDDFLVGGVETHCIRRPEACPWFEPREDRVEIRTWFPAPPDGAGWRLGFRGIDSEGPVVCFWREITTQASGGT